MFKAGIGHKKILYQLRRPDYLHTTYPIFVSTFITTPYKVFPNDNSSPMPPNPPLLAHAPHAQA
jgi:hypothetical protein